MGKKASGVRIKQVGGMKPPSKAALASMMQQPPKLEDFMVPPEEQISLPPPMNKKYQMFYPIHETFTMQTDTFQIIYPSYIDPTKTIQQGRRVPLHLMMSTGSTAPTGTSKVVNRNTTDDMIPEMNHADDLDGDTENDIVVSPTIQEISQVLQALNIRHVIQPYRCYSRCDPYENPGRCLVDIKTHYKNKYELLVVVAKDIQQLPSRPARMEQERIRQQELRDQLQALTTMTEQSVNAATITTTTTTGTVTSSSNKKKSGKKKK